MGRGSDVQLIAAAGADIGAGGGVRTGGHRISHEAPFFVSCVLPAVRCGRASAWLAGSHRALAPSRRPQETESPAYAGLRRVVTGGEVTPPERRFAGRSGRPT